MGDTKLNKEVLDTVTVTLPGSVLKAGFWLYVWRVTTCDGVELLYVGRTGDSSSANAAPPYRRLGQHLGMVKASNALRTHLESKQIDPESCSTFEFIAHGPLFEKQPDLESHKTPRDIVAALEKALADALAESGYDVLNSVRSLKPLDGAFWSGVRNAFAQRFPRLEPSSDRS
jgi:hypothetical protein